MTEHALEAEMNKHMISLWLIGGAVLSLLAALGSMLLGFTDIDRWWTNPLMWAACILLFLGYWRSQKEIVEMHAESIRAQGEAMRALAKAIEAHKD